MKVLTLIKKSAFILSLVPLLSVAALYAGPSDVIARGQGEHRGGAQAGHHQLAHPAAAGHELHHGELHRGVENRGAFDRGVEAGAVGGAAVGGIGGAAVETPVYVAPTQPVQYVAPVPVTPAK